MSVDTEFQKYIDDIKEAVGKDKWVSWTYEKVGNVEKSTLETSRFSLHTIFIVGILLGMATTTVIFLELMFYGYLGII
jgi:uncharacterized transporter YbjL